MTRKNIHLLLVSVSMVLSTNVSSALRINGLVPKVCTPKQGWICDTKVIPWRSIHHPRTVEALEILQQRFDEAPFT